jgi:hypothetical protein
VKHYTQTRIHSEQQNGDCWATAIECILDLPLGTLPRWENNDTSYWQTVMTFLAHHYGLWCQRVDASAHSMLHPVGFHIINGDSPRFAGLGHSVVGFDGDFFHDPHPDGSYVSRVTEWEFYVPIPEDALVWYHYLKTPCPCGCGKGAGAEP